jgi:hypothetical protein
MVFSRVAGAGEGRDLGRDDGFFDADDAVCARRRAGRGIDVNERQGRSVADFVANATIA